MVGHIRSRVWVGLLAILALFGGAGRSEASPIVFNAANGHYYMLSTGSQNWTQAQAEALAVGGYLVSITSLAEQTFLETTFLTGANDRSIYWTGATDQASEGTFVWVNGDPFTYSNWAPGEPNNCACVPGGEDFGTINWHYGLFQSLVKGTWNDTSLTGNEFAPGRVTQGIIEFDTNPLATPEPASLFMLGAGLLIIHRRLRRRR